MTLLPQRGPDAAGTGVQGARHPEEYKSGFGISANIASSLYKRLLATCYVTSGDGQNKPDLPVSLRLPDLKRTLIPGFILFRLGSLQLRASAAFL
nr:guanine nucleotide-binding protein G(I)/G(S)/G(O) subunit gamma-2 isoform X1 [Equus asinus]